MWVIELNRMNIIIKEPMQQRELTLVGLREPIQAKCIGLYSNADPAQRFNYQMRKII
jgi:hypothetical protein